MEQAAIDEFLDDLIQGFINNAAVDRLMATNSVSLVTIPDVPILEAGVEYELSTGKATFTPEDLRDAMTAANEDPSIPTPRFKLGHVDPRFNAPQFDATPAFGKFVNLRLDNNGMVLRADHVGAPKWLAEIAASAYPSRSVEGYWNIESRASNTTWRFVLTAVSALGIAWPGIRQLEDLPLYYGDTIPDDVEVVAASTGGDRMDDVAASANLDDVRRAFYNQYVPENSEAMWWWIRAVLVDPNELIVEDDESGQLFRLAFSSESDGEVSFSEAQAVRIDYVDEKPTEEKKAAATYVAGMLAVGRKVVASWSTRAESRPSNPEGGAMDRNDAIQRLGLPADATDEQIRAALSELAGAFVAPATPDATAAGGSDGGGATAPDGGATPPVPAPVAPQAAPAPPTAEELIAAAQATPPATPAAPPAAPTAPVPAAPAAVAAADLVPAGGRPAVMIDQGNLEALLASVNLGVQAHQRLLENENKDLLAQAMAAGKFPPARHKAWEDYLKADPDGAKEALAQLQPGLVPIDEIGLAGSGEGHEQVTYPVELYPEIQKRKQREAAIAAGHSVRSRVQTDGSLRRGAVNAA